MLDIIKEHKYIFIVCSLLFVLVLSNTYIKWEYLSWRYSDEFVEPILRDIENGCLIAVPKKLKVMKYSNNQAKLFMKDIDNSTYVLQFYRSNAQWTLIYNGVCYAYQLQRGDSSIDDFHPYWYF